MATVLRRIAHVRPVVELKVARNTMLHHVLAGPNASKKWQDTRNTDEAPQRGHIVARPSGVRDEVSAQGTQRSSLLRRDFESVCTSLSAHLIEVNGEEDHVHMLVEYPPTLQLSRLANLLKGSSSRRLRAERLPEVAAKLWGGTCGARATLRPHAAARRSRS